MGKITATDRLIFTLLFSVIIHLTIVLGVGFGVSSPPTNQPLNNLEITLVKYQTELPAEEADFLAQANNEGGGETEEKSPEPTPIVEQPTPTITESSPPPAAPTPAATETIAEIQPSVEQTIATEQITEEPMPPVVAMEEKPQSRPDKAIVQEKAERLIQQVIEKTEERQLDPVITPVKPRISARNLKLPNLNEIAKLQREFDASVEALSKRPKKRRISAATKEYAAAAYMRGWAIKVERIGNTNYPQEAKRQNINGSLMLIVDINPDGSVDPSGIVVSRSSGFAILDDAAVRIVRLGAPYAVVPDNVLQGYDVLTITRTWKFETSHGLSSNR